MRWQVRSTLVRSLYAELSPPLRRRRPRRGCRRLSADTGEASAEAPPTTRVPQVSADTGEAPAETPPTTRVPRVPRVPRSAPRTAIAAPPTAPTTRVPFRLRALRRPFRRRRGCRGCRARLPAPPSPPRPRSPSRGFPSRRRWSPTRSRCRAGSGHGSAEPGSSGAGRGSRGCAERGPGVGRRNFFDDLGADSMVMARFCAQVRKRDDLPSVSIKDIYRHRRSAAWPARCHLSPRPPRRRRRPDRRRVRRGARGGAGCGAGVGRRHFFDDLGADSMVMARFCARVRKRPDLPSVSIKDIYRHPTISGLAGALALAAAPATPAPSAVAARSPRCWRTCWAWSRCRSTAISSTTWVRTRW